MTGKFAGELIQTGLGETGMIEINLPLNEEVVRKLKVGELVSFNGTLFTGRESFYLRAVEKNILPPIDFESINLMMHVGPVVKKVKQKWTPVSLTPTTSIRMEKYCHIMIEKLHTRAIIGKGTMGEKTISVMQQQGCVHLCGIGINANVLAQKIKEVKKVHFIKELGPTEATWIFEVEGFGPFVVDIDTKGDNLFSHVNLGAKEKMKRIYEKHGISTNYSYTPI